LNATTVTERSTPEEVIAIAKSLAPRIRERSTATNEARRVPDETIHELLQSGLFKLLQPKRFGGVEADLETFSRAVMEIARGCGSVGWVFSVLSIHQWIMGLHPEEAQNDVWGKNPDTLVASAFRPSGQVRPEKGGYRLSGRWGFASGCDNSGWISVGAIAGMAGEPPHPVIKLFLVPLSEGTIIDDWHVMGLRGTGSKTVSFDNVFVPEHRVLDFFEAKEARSPGRAVNPGPLYRLPAFANFPICLASPAVGIAWGAYERFLEYLQDRTSIARRKIAEYPTIQQRVAEASVMIDSAELLLRRDCREVMDTAIAGREMPLALRARFRRDHCYAPILASQAVEKLLRASGGQGLFDDFEIQRCYRDVYATASHIGTNWDAGALQFGQTMLGVGKLEPFAWI
jgi:alkylation response protein AidB-like acyl-CoA dehydrogenase